MSQQDDNIRPSQVPQISRAVTSCSPGSRKRRMKSDVWEDFDYQKDGDGKEYAICHNCDKRFKANTLVGTTSLRNHRKRCKKDNDSEEDEVMDGKVKFGNFMFDPDVSRRVLACAIILHGYHLSIVDHVGFRRFVASLQPLFKMVSRYTIEKDIMDIYDVGKKMMKMLKNLNCRISMTTDMWTSNQKRGYLSITVHYIDDSWILQSRILRFVYVPTPHTKEVLSDVLVSSLLDWNIDRKTSTLTVDNCTRYDGMIRLIAEKLSTCSGSLLLDGKVLHMRCCTHILNLIVKDGLIVIRRR